MDRIVERCPVCAATMAVTQLTCRSCATRIEGEFAPSPFSALSPEQSGFLDAFLRCRGNLSDVQKALDISYPTARNRLDDVLQALGYAQEPQLGREERVGLLEALDRGEITVEQALKALRRD